MGYLRLFLAMCVVACHLGDQMFAFTGSVAVFCFYTISGYLISAAIETAYQGRPLQFAANRAIRLLPAYWLIALLGLLIAWLGTPINPAVRVPLGFDDWWRQFAIIGLLHIDNSVHPIRLVPPAWSLNMELVWYAVLFVCWRYTKIMAVAAVVAAVFFLLRDWQDAYFNYFGPACCFLAGSIAWRMRLRLSQWNLPIAAAALAGVMVWSVLPPWSYFELLVGSGCCLYVIVSIGRGRPTKADRLAGDLAYPVFLSHWHVASLVGLQKGTLSLAINTPIVLLLSLAIVFLVDRPLRGIRTSVRGRPAGTDLAIG